MDCRAVLSFTGLFIAGTWIGLSANVAQSDKAALPPKPPLPAIKALSMQPASLTLQDGRDIQRVLVWGET